MDKLSHTQKSGNINQKSLFMTIAAPILWSFGALGIRSVEASSWSIIFYRSIAMSIAVFLLCFVIYKKNVIKVYRNIGRPGLLVSIFLGITTLFYVLSLSKTTVANALLVQGTAPIWATILGIIFLKEKVKILNWLTIIASFIGIIVLVANQGIKIHFLGDIFALITAFGLAAQILIIRKNPHIEMIPIASIGGLIAAIFSLFFKPSFQVNFHDLSILICLGTFQIGLGYILFYRGSKDLPPSLSSLITLLETVLGPIWVLIFLGEKISSNAVIGGLIIIISLVCNTLITTRIPSKTSETK
ncbi:MAG: EamA family transporter [Spirochaetes bacterium]|nr:EamA family transporter [Spirochaetota bacterium]MBP8991147.1 EamA family transporter [Spirochaetota bacterium]NLJ04521.1 EamA family transporter [Exilispira sp.]HOV46619.1 GRP family sugar transporter [Exilispira sp.]